MPHDADVIVVGGGHNGLTCAAYLARHGLAVELLEARSSVGGCASTVDAVGARVNICNCDHIAVRTLPLVEELDLAAHGLRYIDVDPGQMAISWDGAPAWFAFHDVERTVEYLRRAHPDQADAYRRFVDDAAPVARLAMEAASGPPSPIGIAGVALRHGGRGAARLLQWSRRSAAEVLHDYFSPDFAGTFFGGAPAVWGCSPHWKGTGTAAMAAVMKHLVPVGRPVGGSGALTAALAGSFEAAGGRIRTDARVTTIVCEGDRVAGVRLADGTDLRAPRVVVACDPRAAFVEWLIGAPASASEFVARWRDHEPEPGYESKIDARVDALPRYLGVDETLSDEFGADPLLPTAMICPDADGIDAAHHDFLAGRVSDRPVMLVNFPSVADPTMAPAGEHVMSLEVLFTPYDLAAGWETTAEAERWLGRYATLVEDGFLDGVREFRVMNPVEYERQFHMPKGHATSFAGGPVAALLGRDKELSRYRTPVDGLFLTGAATFPGAGVWGAPGRNAAHVIAADADRNPVTPRIRLPLPT